MPLKTTNGSISGAEKLLENTMKLPLVAMLILQLVSPTSFAADGVQYEDRLKIAMVLETLSIAWRFGESDVWSEPFVDDAYFTVFYDMGEKDSEMIAWDYRFIFDYFQADTFFDLSMRHIRFIKPDVVVVELSGFYVETDEEVTIKRYLIPTATLKRNNADWKVVSFTNTPFIVNELRANGDLLRFKRIAAKGIRVH
jgi:uncharacterized protein (TIGR02246 family)